jgi:hypothetical protein
VHFGGGGSDGEQEGGDQEDEEDEDGPPVKPKSAKVRLSLCGTHFVAAVVCSLAPSAVHRPDMQRASKLCLWQLSHPALVLLTSKLTLRFPSCSAAATAALPRSTTA